MNLLRNRIKNDLEKAISLIQQGKLSKARDMLQMLLKIEKKNPDIYHLLGVAENMSGNKKEASRLIKKAIKINSKIGIYHRNLGLIYHDMNVNDAAVSELRKAISLDHNNSQTYCDLGVIYSKLGRTNDALDQYKRSISKDRNNVIAITNLANSLCQVGVCSDAEKYYQRAIKIAPNYAPAYFGLGNLHKNTNNFSKAIKCYERVLTIDGSFSDAAYNIGEIKSKLGESHAAIESFLIAVRINGRHYQSHNALGNEYKILGLFDEAIASYKQSIFINPKNDKAYNGLGNVLSDLGELCDAIKSYNNAVDVNPYNSDAYNGLGNVYKDNGNLNESINCYRKSISIDSGNVTAHANLSHVLLMLGDFCDGWKEYEWGLLDRRHRRRTEFDQLVMPRWQGESLDNKMVLVGAEQGVGDEVMFASCLTDLIRKKPAEIILECDPRLEPIFSRSFTLIKSLGNRKQRNYDWLKGVGNIDYYIPIGSLPSVFRKEIDDFVPPVPYLNVDQTLQNKWKQRYSSIGDGMKIGLSWRGGANIKTKRSRSIEIQSLLSIVEKKSSFVNLQYGDCSDEISYLYDKSGIVLNDWDDLDPLIDLDNFIAAISELDLVISVDNSTVHLAGAIGVPTWVLVPYTADWRWMIDREHSLWYRDVSVFRQTNLGDWGDVIKRVSVKLDSMIQ